MPERVREVGDPQRPSRLSEDPETIDEPRLAFFLDYWRGNRAGASLPLRASFVPKEVKAHLASVMVIDALDQYIDFRYRVVGSRICDYFLRDGTGKTVREAFAGLSHDLVDGRIALYRLACVTRMPVRLQAPASLHKGIFFPAFDALYLPYSLGGKHADRLIGVFTFDLESLAWRSSAAVQTTSFGDLRSRPSRI